MALGNPSFASMRITGSLNRHTEWEEYTGQVTKQRVAYCSSHGCLRRAHGTAKDSRGSTRLKSHKLVRKEAHHTAWQCPDCHQVLFWELE